MHIRFTALVLSLCLLFCLLPPNARAEEVTVEVDKNAILSGLFEADVADIRDAILEGLVTSREVTEYYLNRIKDYNKPYNCFITICDDALSQADARDAQLAKGLAEGLLFGVPIVVKDNIDVEGVHTTNGYKKKDSQIAKDNAAAVQKLIDQGAVILAKTNMSTGAKEAHWSKSEVAGETKNAYNKYYSPGGSSGGSSTAVSLNFAAPRNCEQLLLDIALAYSAKYDHRVAPAGAPDDYITSSAGSLRDVLNDYYARLEAAKNPPTEPVTEEKGEQPAKWKVPTAAVIVLCICAVCVAGVYVHEKRKQKARKRRINPLAK